MNTTHIETLHRFDLPQGGFAGLKEHRLVTDSRMFGGRKQPQTFEGIGNFVYLADAQFMPHGQTTLHPHHEIDVISVMVEGRISHEGSLEHGQDLETGAAQVQRAGGEGFSHNEVNPDTTENRMLQLWVLPDDPGEPAGYKVYQPEGVRTKIYGGSKHQDETFDSQTQIDISLLKEGERFEQTGEALIYVAKGDVQVHVHGEEVDASDGTLIRVADAQMIARQDSQLVVVYVA